jgi:hypothetical protein
VIITNVSPELILSAHTRGDNIQLIVGKCNAVCIPHGYNTWLQQLAAPPAVTRVPTWMRSRSATLR